MPPRTASSCARSATALLALVSSLLGGCAEPFPRDPEGTANRVQASGVIRVGVTEHPPWIERGPTKAPTGSEARLVLAFAERRGARVEWTWGQLEALFAALSESRLDLVVGGIDADTPWKDRLAMTEPWQTQSDGSGVPFTRLRRANYPAQVVLAVPPGENRWLGEVDRFAHEFATDELLSQTKPRP